MLYWKRTKTRRSQRAKSNPGLWRGHKSRRCVSLLVTSQRASRQKAFVLWRRVPVLCVTSCFGQTFSVCDAKHTHTLISAITVCLSCLDIVWLSLYVVHPNEFIFKYYSVLTQLRRDDTQIGDNTIFLSFLCWWDVLKDGLCWRSSWDKQRGDLWKWWKRSWG